MFGLEWSARPAINSGAVWPVAAELRSALRPHPITDGQDGIEVVVLDFPLDFARSFPANYLEFPDSCLLFDLPFLVDVLEMLVDGPDILLEQFRNERLAQPKRFVDKTALDPRAAVFCLVQDNLASRECGITGHGRLVLRHSEALYRRSARPGCRLHLRSAAQKTAWHPIAASRRGQVGVPAALPSRPTCRVIPSPRRLPVRRIDLTHLDQGRVERIRLRTRPCSVELLKIGVHGRFMQLCFLREIVINSL
jgi:hypothetical protein